MTVANRKPSADDKVEAKLRIIRQSLGQITAEVECTSMCQHALAKMRRRDRSAPQNPPDLRFRSDAS